MAIEVGLAVLTQGAIAIVWASAIRRAARSAYARRQWAALFGAHGTPIALWAVFAGGGLVLLVYPLAPREYYGVSFSGFNVVAVSLVAWLGAVTYQMAFSRSFDQWSGGRRRSGRQSFTTIPAHWLLGPEMALVLYSLFALDVLLRLRLILGGAYFAWLVDSFDTTVTRGINTDPLFQFQIALWPFVVSLAAYRAFGKPPTRGLAWLVLLVEGLATLLTGQRFLMALFAIILWSAFLVARPERLRQGLRTLVIGLIAYLLIVAPGIQIARYALRDSASAFSQNPSLVVVAFLVDYLPRATVSGTGPDHLSIESQFWPRVAASAAYAASIHERITQGAPLLDDELDAMAQLVPRVLASAKPSIDSDAVAQAHFAFGTPGVDAAGTVLADAFGHGHVLGVVVLYASGGFILGSAAAHAARRSEELAGLLLIAGWPVYLPLGDSFAYYFAGIRNYLLVGIIVWFVVDRAWIASSQRTSTHSEPVAR